MDEFDLINRFFKRDTVGASVALGVGDDCALLDIPRGYQLALSIDTLLPDVHFFADADPGLIAERALSVSISDLAAMGAEPLAYTLALTLPEVNECWLAGFSEGLVVAEKRYGCSLIGGDTTRGPLCISVQVHGIVPCDAAIKRSGAHHGDLVCVSGCLGDGAAALASLQGELLVDSEAQAYFDECYHRPLAQLDLGFALRGIASAGIDISDGLLSDLGHICSASGLGAELDLRALPYSSAMLAHVDAGRAKTWALTGGDDYQLCFTVPPHLTGALGELMATDQYPITVIGAMTATSGIFCRESGQMLNQSDTGYKHFQ